MKPFIAALALDHWVHFLVGHPTDTVYLLRNHVLNTSSQRNTSLLGGWKPNHFSRLKTTLQMLPHEGYIPVAWCWIMTIYQFCSTGNRKNTTVSTIWLWHKVDNVQIKLITFRPYECTNLLHQIHTNCGGLVAIK